MVIVKCRNCSLELHSHSPIMPPVIVSPGTASCQHDLTATGSGEPRLIGVFVLTRGSAEPPPTPPAEPAPEVAPDLLAPWARYLETLKR